MWYAIAPYFVLVRTQPATGIFLKFMACFVFFLRCLILDEYEMSPVPSLRFFILLNLFFAFQQFYLFVPFRGVSDQFSAHMSKIRSETM